MSLLYYNYFTVGKLILGFLKFIKKTPKHKRRRERVGSGYANQFEWKYSPGSHLRIISFFSFFIIEKTYFREHLKLVTKKIADEFLIQVSERFYCRKNEKAMEF